MTAPRLGRPLRCGHGRHDGTVVDRGRRDPIADRSRPDGGGVGAGVPPAGAAVRSRPRVLRDGVVVRPFVRQRAHAGIPAHRHRRAPARGADLRLRPRPDGRGGAHGRRRRRRHRRHQLRLPGAQGHEDRRRCERARGSCSGLRAGRSRRRRSGRAGDGEDAPRPSQRLARGARSRPEARGGGRGLAHAASALGPADVHGHRRPHAHGGAGRAGGRPGGRLRRHHRPRHGRAGDRLHRRRGGHGRARCPGAALGPARDGGRGRRRRRRGRGRGRARAVHARGRARDGRTGGRVPAQVLRLVPARHAGGQGASAAG